MTSQASLGKNPDLKGRACRESTRSCLEEHSTCVHTCALGHCGVGWYVCKSKMCSCLVCLCSVHVGGDICAHVSAHALCFGGNVQTVYIPGVCLCVALLWVYIVSVSSPVNCAGVFAHVCWVFMCMFVCLHKCAHVLYVCTCKCIGRYPNQNTEEALAPDQYLDYNSFFGK